MTSAPTVTAPAWWTRTETLMSAADPSFAHRPQQAQAAEVLDLAMRGRRHAALDLPTGSGKSLLALSAAQEATGRTVISTATKALQAQMRDKDIPALQAAGVLTKSVTVLEGRGNYVCLNRARREVKRAQPAAAKTIRIVIAHLEEHPRAARRDNIPTGIPDWVWTQICSDSDACTALKCRGSRDCAYTASRDEARTSEIVVINHSLLLADAMIKGGGAVNWGKRPESSEEKLKPAVLGPYRNLIIDEAHALENAAENFGEQRVTVRGIQALMTRISKLAGSGTATMHLAACLDEFKAAMIGLPTGALLGAASVPELLTAAVEAEMAGKAIRDRASTSFEGDADGDIYTALCYKLRTRLESISTALETGIDKYGPRAVSVEAPPSIRRGGSVDPSGMKSQLVDAAPWLQEHLFHMVPTIAMSGTLAVPGRRDWVTNRIGLEAPVMMLPTAFDLAAQRLVYVTPRTEAKGAFSMARSTDADVIEIQQLIEASGGRALVLFPANVDLKFVESRLKISHTLLAQGVTTDGRTAKGDPVMMGNAELARRFTDDKTSVLLATRSFFEGVDFPGEQCSLVIIVRFPNLRPDDPLTLARRRLIDGRGGNAWAEYQEPAMQLVFRQAAGRAIRRVDDRGVVAVIDPRSGSKNYAKTALRSLRPSKYTDQLSEVRQFLK